jgi:hypothetical protein
MVASERSILGRIGAHESWARTQDRSARTAPARAAFDARFEQQVDPDGVLSQDERARRADHARRAHFQRLALKSAVARRKAAGLNSVADAADAEMAEFGGDAA